MLKNTEKKYYYFDVIMALFVAVLLISNVASTKIVQVWHFSFDGGTLLFPLSYLFGDILTEVYGYKMARKVIWVGFFSAALMTVVLMAVNALPAADGWPYQEAFQNILGQTPRIVLASLIAYFTGEFFNSYIMAKLKIKTEGKHLWLRTISSTLVGEGIDTMLFISIAFLGALSQQLFIAVFVSNYFFKTGVEIVFTPLTYKVVKFLKRKENEDFYDRGTDFNPFSFS